MYNSNGFNVCPHCGKPNSLNARFCARCGKQLTMPDEITVCPKCRKTNSPMASFCGHCGAPLKEGTPTKICPRCGKSVSLSDNVCICGYNFGTAYSVNTKKYRRRNGGRAIAFFGLLLTLLFAYFIFMPACVLRPDVVSATDQGIFVHIGETDYMYGFDIIKFACQSVCDGGMDSLVASVGVGGVSVIVMCMAVALSVVVRLIIYFVRLFTSVRSKHINVVLLILAILATLWTVMWAICKYLIPDGSAQWLLSVREVFVPACANGYVMFALPVYFWFFYAYTACTKIRVLHEQMMW